MVKYIYKKGTAHEKIGHYDVLILGAGPAGLTAAIYAGRYKLKTAVVAKSFGGAANLAGELENWPGYIGNGLELMQKFKEQAEKFGARFLEAEVTKVEKDKDGFVLEIGDREIHGKTLIVTLGTEHRKLNIPGEEEFLGKGVSYCVTCDANFFKEKNVAVIGGADSAAKAALYLAEIAKKVYVIYRKNEMRCEPVSLQKIEKHKKINLYYQSIPVKIEGDKTVLGLVIEQEQKEGKMKKIKLDVSGVFIVVGATPVINIVKNLELAMNKEGYIITDKEMKTNVGGVFAAGDVTDNNMKQVVTASGEGAVAAKSAYEFLKFSCKKE